MKDLNVASRKTAPFQSDLIGCMILICAYAPGVFQIGEIRMLTIDKIFHASVVLKNIVRATNIVHTEGITEDCSLFLKPENLQKTGSFKLRGSGYKIAMLSEEEKARGVIACSAGNHAQGVALAATKSGVKSLICLPDSAPISKIEATKKYGAQVCLVEGVYDDAYNRALELKEERGYTFVHPFDDEDVIAGQGTIGLEILEQLPEVEQIVVPIGGGGLISGVAYAVKHLKPECRVVGVQAVGAPSMYLSLRAGEPSELKIVATIADGIAVKRPGDLTFALCREYVDEVVTVTEDEIASAILALMEEQKTVAEGAGAASVAACMFGKVELKGRKTVCLVSGGNVDVTTLSRIITKGLSKAGRLVELTTKVEDKPGSLLRMLQVVADSGANIISVSHSREDKESDVRACIVTMVLETRDSRHAEALQLELSSRGYLMR